MPLQVTFCYQKRFGANLMGKNKTKQKKIFQCSFDFRVVDKGFWTCTSKKKILPLSHVLQPSRSSHRQLLTPASCMSFQRYFAYMSKYASPLLFKQIDVQSSLYTLPYFIFVTALRGHITFILILQMRKLMLKEASVLTQAR